MTTWYSGPGGWRAFSVRPDLWPPGWMVWEKFDHAVGRWPPGYLADTMTIIWPGRLQQVSEDQGLSDPRGTRSRGRRRRLAEHDGPWVEVAP